MNNDSQTDDGEPDESGGQRPRSRDPEFWQGYRVERVGGTVYLENEAGVEAFTAEQARAYAIAILRELHDDE